MSRAAAAEPDLGTLPEWDLSDLYPGPESVELANDFGRLADDVAAFGERNRGKVAELTAPALARAIGEYERIEEGLGRISSYAQLLHAGDLNDAEIGRFFQNTTERINGISAEVLFFTLEINRMDDADIERLLGDGVLARYAAWIRNTRLFRDHQLGDDLERLLHDKEVAGRGAWVRLFDETSAALRFDIDGKRLTSEEALHLLSHRDETVRGAAARELGRVFGDNIRLFALIANTLAKDKEIEDRWRGYPAPNSARHLANQVEPEVVEALAAAVKDAYPRLSHRYYRLKADWLGKERLAHWDRNAPLPDDDDRSIPWDRAVGIVLDAYRAFSGELADFGRRFFDHAWIDAPVRPGKAGGAFAHPTVPSAHPYLLLKLPGPDARRDDAGARARPRRPPAAGGAARRAAGRCTADPGRNRFGVRRAARLSRAAGRRERGPAAARHAGRQGRGRHQHRGPAGRVLTSSSAACTRSAAAAS